MVEPTQIVLDELHLLLRIGDVLLRNIILQADSLDRRVCMGQRVQTQNHIRTLEMLVRQRGVSFIISQVQDEKNKPVGMFSWTALNRKQKLTVLRDLPPKLNTILPDDDAAQISDLWKDFVELYQMICSHFPSPEEIHSQGKQWITHFLALSRLEGYQRKCVTPYMHSMVYHIPAQIRMYGTLIRFSGQGVEKNNDVAKRCYYSSNEHDPCGEVLRTEKHQESLDHCRREKRAYLKKDTEYWIMADRRKRPQLETED